MALGVFDSGIGGLTVYRELIKAYPKTDMYYLGDTARVPYGNKPPETIIRYSKECANYLIKNYNVTGLVAACNTISCYALDEIATTYGLPIVGVIQAGSEQAITSTRNKKIGVIGTRATVNSGIYVKTIEELSDSSVMVWQKACPLLVPLVEEGIITGDIPKLTIKMYLDDLIDKGIDTLVLACTHYPLLAKTMQNIYPDIHIVDSAMIMIEKVQRLVTASSETGKRKILVTDTPSFGALSDILIGDIPVNTVVL